MEAIVQTQSYVVYLFGPSPDGKYYVGQTENYSRRIRDHQKAAGGCPRFHEAIHMHGWDAIPLRIIAEMHVQEEADRLEILNIAKYNSLWPDGYNMTLGGRATRFDPDARIVGFEEAAVSDDKILAEAKERLAQNDRFNCPVCECPSSGLVCLKCGISKGFGRAALTHFVSQDEFEAFTLPGTARAAKDFRECRAASIYVNLMKSRTGRDKRIAEILPLAAIQYLTRLLPFLRASLRRSVLIKRKEPSFSLGRFIAYVGRSADVRLEINLNRHLRQHRKEMSTNSVRHIEVFRSAIVALSGRECAAQPLIEKLLLMRGATSAELDEAARDALLIRQLNDISNAEYQLRTPDTTGSVSVFNDEKGAGFKIVGSDESVETHQHNLFASELTHFIAHDDRPAFMLMHDGVKSDCIITIAFAAHGTRRDFISALAGKSTGERVISLRETIVNGGAGVSVAITPIEPAKIH